MTFSEEGPFSRSKSPVLSNLGEMITQQAGVVTSKVVLIGSSGTGKSSILHRLIYNSFETNKGMTVAAAVRHHVVNVNNKSVKLNIWDTAGQETFRSLCKIYFRDCQIAVVVFDITNRESFNDVNFWLNELVHVSGENHVRMLIGNKKDLAANREVSEEEAGALSDSWHCLGYREVSAANGTGVVEIFEEMARVFLDKEIARETQIGKGELEKEKSSKKCCS
jgi:small GTP-binding protein